MLRTVPALLLAVTASMAQAAPHPYSVDDQVMLDRVSAPRLSPDAKSLIYQLRETDMAADRGVNSLWRLDLATAGARRLTAAALGAHDGQWSADGRSIYFLASHEGVQQLWRMPAAGGEATVISRLPVDVEAFVLSRDGAQVALLLDVFPACDRLECTAQRLEAQAASPARGRLYSRLFIRHWDRWDDGRTTQLFVAGLGEQGLTSPRALSATLDADVTEPAFAPDGRFIAFSARLKDGEPWSTNFDLYEVPVAGDGAPRNLTAGNPAWDAGPVYAPDGRTLYYRAMRRAGFEADRFAIRALDRASGESRELAADWDRSATVLALSSDGRTLYTSADELGQHKLFAFDMRQQRVKALTGAGTVGEFDVGGGEIVYTLDTLDSPAQLYRIARGGAKPLGTINAARLAEIEFGEYEQFSFKGADGDTVYGYVMKPVGYEDGKAYPVAFIVHGGPQGSMGNHFHYRWNPQTYAGAGYAVVFIDFHGSSGYGQDFTDSISRDWGGKPLEDLQKGWAHALDRYAFLDGDRSCALGASYGGFMINWIAGHWPDAFQCLVNHDGIFDQRSMYYATEELWFPEWEHGGPAYENPEAFERFNPSAAVERWRTPMLVAHSALDYRVPLEQGIAAFTALQRRGIPSQFLYFPDENHWILKPHNSVQWHRTVEAWLDRWIGEES